MSRLIFSTRVDGTDVPVFFSGVQGDKPYVGVSELLGILGHSKTHSDEFPRSETKLWQDLAPNDTTYPPNKLFTTEVGFAVYFGKTKLTNWASFKRMFDTINSYIADPTSCSATNPLCMIPPGHSSGSCTNPNPGRPNGGCDLLSQIYQGVQNNSQLLQTILADVRQILNNGGGSGTVDLTPVLDAIALLNTSVADIQNSLTSLNQDVSSLQNDLDTRLTQLDNTVTALTSALQTLQTDVSAISADLPNIETALANIIATLNAFVSGALAQWGNDVWDTTTYPVPTITNPFPQVSVTRSNNNLPQDVVSTLNNLQVEVKRLNDYTEDFEKLLKNVDVKVTNK
ncbi:polyhedron envelope/P10 fusion protein [Erinnyis ello granulovirus]|uniref:Polyhedron envelope protein fused to p10 n=1 Tax=Erinnyis ello granulovirus TaxID=307444 RepID=A0A097DAH5_9BBAC|nr:polyhedron envelope/P10 fusion protein [Erinnyis ello granulovirus]AIS92021.1 polyhedron envelope/P10 fusion protein [Erinnyis ello granulovirus]ARX71360.1 polyhedron envelope protein fused to p10 [Erinnyis ello granulovirus]ARX71490.1 polyhedron envelope protein fused to p10 [Erinnyis ello granulovirus]ARX71620.1 polyhedron envelope protein fused to p10 [Erinnyis ello granulovirus]ARX71750.1 polyhedron envelope protein fused to p10 [Erinnyis ello granulovirus]